MYLRVHGLRVWDPENKKLVVPAWLAVEFKSSRVQEFVINIIKSSDNCGLIVKRVPASYEPII